MHLYHLLCKWEAEEDRIHEANPKRLRDRVKQGVSIVTVPVAAVAKKDPTPTMLKKYEPFFAELEKNREQFGNHEKECSSKEQCAADCMLKFGADKQPVCKDNECGCE